MPACLLLQSCSLPLFILYNICRRSNYHYGWGLNRDWLMMGFSAQHCTVIPFSKEIMGTVVFFSHPGWVSKRTFLASFHRFLGGPMTVKLVKNCDSFLVDAIHFYALLCAIWSLPCSLHSRAAVFNWWAVNDLQLCCVSLEEGNLVVGPLGMWAAPLPSQQCSAPCLWSKFDGVPWTF